MIVLSGNEHNDDLFILDPASIESVWYWNGNIEICMKTGGKHTLDKAFYSTAIIMSLLREKLVKEDE